MRKRNFGWVPDLPDHRDFFYKTIMPALKALPEKVDLRKKCSQVEDQGALGSCTANALAGALEYLDGLVHLVVMKAVGKNVK